MEHTKKFMAVLFAVLLALGVVSCSSDGGGSDDAGATDSQPQAGGTDEGDGGDAAGVDPCSLYGLDEMKALMGAENVTSESAPAPGGGNTCYYTAPDNYLDVEFTVAPGEKYSVMAAVPPGETAIEPGIGDQSAGYALNGAVTLTALSGDVVYSVLITNAGGGEGAGKFVDDAAMEAAGKELLTTVIG